MCSYVYNKFQHVHNVPQALGATCSWFFCVMCCVCKLYSGNYSVESFTCCIQGYIVYVVHTSDWLEGML